MKNSPKLRPHWPLFKSVYQKINFLIFQPKHVVGAQKNRLMETVLLSIPKHRLKLMNTVHESLKRNFTHM